MTRDSSRRITITALQRDARLAERSMHRAEQANNQIDAAYWKGRWHGLLEATSTTKINL